MPATAPDLMPDFALERRQVNGLTLNYRMGGEGPPLLLVHGYPQNHLMWRKVAPALAEHFTLILPDLRGYGDSDKPPSTADHDTYSKRAMAADLHELMLTLGYKSYAVCGHDRGGRVAHRLARDQPQAVSRLMVLDIAPTLTMYQRTDRAFATAYYHWFLLIQPAPLPETLLTNSADFMMRRTFGVAADGSSRLVEPAVFAEYSRCFKSAGAIAAMCEDYRASASIDLEHDAAHEPLQCPLHVVWGSQGVIGKQFDPIADWQAVCATPVTGRGLAAGHFLAEEAPEALLPELLRFFRSEN